MTAMAESLEANELGFAGVKAEVAELEEQLARKVKEVRNEIHRTVDLAEGKFSRQMMDVSASLAKAEAKLEKVEIFPVIDQLMSQRLQE